MNLLVPEVGHHLGRSFYSHLGPWPGEVPPTSSSMRIMREAVTSTPSADLVDYPHTPLSALHNQPRQQELLPGGVIDIFYF